MVYQAGRRYHTDDFVVTYSPEATFRAAVVVGKKVSTLAVRRNRLRRELYEFLRINQTQLPNLAVIVVVKPLYGKKNRALRIVAANELLASLRKIR